jgi:hypothetical protein
MGECLAKQFAHRRALMADEGWSRRFDDPIPLPDGRKLFTLRDAAIYVMELSPKARRLQEWPVAAGALVLVAERGGPTMFAPDRRHAGAQESQIGAAAEAREGLHDCEMRTGLNGA